MKAKKVMALVLCAAMVSGLAATTVMAAPEDQFEGLTANEAYEFPMMVKFSFLYLNFKQGSYKSKQRRMIFPYRIYFYIVIMFLKLFYPIMNSVKKSHFFFLRTIYNITYFHCLHTKFIYRIHHNLNFFIRHNRANRQT